MKRVGKEGREKERRGNERGIREGREPQVATGVEKESRKREALKRSALSQNFNKKGNAAGGCEDEN